MTTAEKREWAAERRNMENIFLGVTGKPTKVLDIEPHNAGELGYTSSKGTIHLAFNHPCMKDLNSIKRAIFRLGVFAHEMLHQILTDFSLLEKEIRKCKPHERMVLATISNLSEDPAIEHFASQVFGGQLLAALKFTIKHIYRQSEELEKQTSPFGQFAHALIHFGDMGLLKGHFTFPEAKSAFAKAAPIFSDCIEEPDPQKRMDYSIKIMEISRPLWEKETEYAKMIEDFIKSLSKSGKNTKPGSRTELPIFTPERDDDDDEMKKKRRKITFRKVEKEELEELEKSGELLEEIPEDGDIEILYTDEDDESSKDKNEAIPSPGKNKESEKSEKEHISPSKKDDNDEYIFDESDSADDEISSVTDALDKPNDNKDLDEEDECDGDESEKNESDSDTTSPTSDKSGKTDKDNKNDANVSSGADNSFERPTNEYEEKKESTNAEADKHALDHDLKDDLCNEYEYDETETVIDDNEYEISDDYLESIKKEVEACIKQLEEEKLEQTREEGVSVENYPITSPKFGAKSCLNNRVTFPESSLEPLMELYNSLLEPLLPGITSLITQLKRIFQNDAEEKLYHTSGKINISRVYGSKVTSRVFDKRRGCTNKADLVVELLVDESGSMNGRNATAAKLCCMALAEVFARLDIPLYVIGFTADTSARGMSGRYDVVHNHYITWNNTPNERLKLLEITARSNNFDGYSIRYAGEVIKRKAATHKLLIVLSDGQPACTAYSRGYGVDDTKDAIRDCKKFTSVLGVAIGSNDTDVIHYMYENDFLHISDVDDLFNGLARKIQDIIKKWD